MLRTLNILVLRVLYMLIYAAGGAIAAYVMICIPLVGLVFAAAWVWQQTHRPSSLSTAHGTAQWAGFLDLFRGGLVGRHPTATRSPRSCRSHQIPSVGICLRLHCPVLDHPFTSLASVVATSQISPNSTQL